MTRRAPLLLAAAAALAGLVWALAGRLLPSLPEELRHRDARLVASAARALEGDATRLERIAKALRADPGLIEVVEGGGTAVRPGQLFERFEAALPSGAGWGLAFFDKSGRAVAWARDAGDVESAADLSRAGLAAVFHVTRFRLAYVLPWGTGADRRGTLVASRRYPTGILRPDLVEGLDLPGGPTLLRVLVRASVHRDALLSLAAAAPSRSASEEDLARRRARGGALLAAAGLLAAGLLSGAPPLGIAAARFALLLGSPRGAGGAWGVLFPAPGAELLATPMDLLLTGIVALAIVRALLERPAPRLPAPLRLAAGLGLAAVPWLLAREAGFARPDLFDDLSLVPESLAILFVRIGALTLAVAALGAAARLLPGGRGARAAGAAGLLLSGAGLLGASAPAAAGAAVLGATLLAAGLAPRAERWRRDALPGRTATSVLLAAAACLVAAAGLAAGHERRLDAAIVADIAEQEQPIRWQARADAWSAALARAPETWLPAGRETAVSDIARAFWARGARLGFPGPGDVLTIRDASGAVVSSFGVTRPGASIRAETRSVAIPVEGLSAQFTHLTDAEEGERDPVLSAVVAEDAADPVPVEHLLFDVAGRSRARGERTELPPRLLDAARRTGHARGTVALGDRLRRIWVRSSGTGFAASSAPADGLTTTFGTALAATECALAPALLVLLGGLRSNGRSRARGGGDPPFATFRARLVALVVLFGALPLAGSVAVVRLALERHAASETGRRAHAILAEARRALAVSSTLDERDLNRTAQVVGSDLLLYRDGRLLYASRALPVAAEVARDRLQGSVAAALADGRREALSSARRATTGSVRLVEAAEPIGDGSAALAVVIAEDEGARTAVDGLVLFTVAVALFALGFAGRAALALSRPLDAVIASAERLGAGAAPESIERPAMADLRRLVDAFEAMARRVSERTEMLAREREAAVGLLANLTAAVVLFRERDGQVLLANPAADQLLPGTDLTSRLAPHPPIAAALAAAADARPWETRLTLPIGGRERLVRIVVASLPPDEGERRALLLLEDLTDFARAERLTAWVDAARAIAHDVKNPLTPVRLSAERLLRMSARGTPPEGATLEGAAVSILRQVEILTERFGRLSRFTDPSALETAPLDREGVARLLSEVASDYGGGAVSVKTEVAPELPPLRADRALLRDALSNFVVNALEALSDAGGSVTLGAAPDRLGEAEAVRFTCADDGPGVPAELLPRLFEPAFSTKSRGSGIGLAATRRAIERHGGTVFAGPRPEGGLAVGFVLPASPSL